MIEANQMLLIVTAAVLVPFWALLAAASALLERAGPIRLRHWVEDAGPRLRQLYDQPARFRSFRTLLSLFARLLPLVLVAVLYPLALSGREAITALILSAGSVAVLIALIEWLDGFLVKRYAESALRRLTRPLRMAALLLWPLIWLLGRFTPSANGNGSSEELEDDATETEISAYIDVGRREGILEPEEEELVRSIVDFGDNQVRRVMTPRVEIVSAPVDSSLAELADVFFESKHARLPLYRESVDHIAGILHIRDLFEAIHHGRESTAAELAKPPLFVPESKPLRDLLAELQTLRQQMAIVVDEYGGVAGLVTVEDLVEEIVGEIADEHEIEEELCQPTGDGGYRVAGRIALPELFDLVGQEPDDLRYETISGLICGELGYVPKPGERLKLHGLDLRIEGADARRVTSVLIHPEVATEAEA